ncbi:UNVERIFIED_CONTAM: hypothetical protein FKN15_024830 [Acipenser sinensis]
MKTDTRVLQNMPSAVCFFSLCLAATSELHSGQLTVQARIHQPKTLYSATY